MQRHQLNSQPTETSINTLRDNPGLDFRLGQLADEPGIAVDELAASCADLARKAIIEHDLTPDGFDVYRFPDAYRRGSTATI
ncbi:hypothetical protein [Kallotenue papyrolyticum]|uniref:hypothetical protein n=1 Tax=Kallotenue papyrolyticum TaxID=1325125 RepID=UPI000470BDB5|nr:hypothetical protein [Kallotenue papyrolyticum]